MCFMKFWLIVDVSYLMHRAFHTTRDLSYRGKPTGAIYGFLKSITALKDEFNTDNIAFCFEHPHLFRRDIYPDYKKHRHTRQRTPEEQKARGILQTQIEELRTEYLPKI